MLVFRLTSLPGVRVLNYQMGNGASFWGSVFPSSCGLKTTSDAFILDVLFVG